MFISLTFAWFITLFLFLIFTYTQVDLNLTILNWPPYLNIQDSLNQLGYYQREANMWFFIGTLVSLLVMYLITIYLVSKNRITKKQLVYLLLLITVVSIFSFNGLSRDIFNYMFYGKIITVYGGNPYILRPMDFPQDEWVRFMHWIHTTYPYGPTFIGLLLVPSVLGFGKFLSTFLLFKLMFAIGYLVICLYIYKIMNILTTNNKSLPLLGIATFALNPMVIINSVTSPHVDIIMAAFAVVAVYYLITGKTVYSVVSLLLSIGTKFATVTLIPLFNSYALKVLGQKYWFMALLILSFLGSVVIQSYGRGMQIWYFLIPVTLLPFLLPFIKLRWVLILNLLPNLYFWTYLIFIRTGQW